MKKISIFFLLILVLPAFIEAQEKLSNLEILEQTQTAINHFILPTDINAEKPAHYEEIVQALKDVAQKMPKAFPVIKNHLNTLVTFGQNWVKGPITQMQLNQTRVSMNMAKQLLTQRLAEARARQGIFSRADKANPVEPITKPLTEPIEQPIEKPGKEPIEQPIVKPNVEPLAQPPVVETPATKPVGEPIVASPVEQPITEPGITHQEEPVAKPRSDEPIVPSIIQPSEIDEKYAQKISEMVNALKAGSNITYPTNLSELENLYAAAQKALKMSLVIDVSKSPQAIQDNILARRKFLTIISEHLAKKIKEEKEKLSSASSFDSDKAYESLLANLLKGGKNDYKHYSHEQLRMVKVKQQQELAELQRLPLVSLPPEVRREIMSKRNYINSLGQQLEKALNENKPATTGSLKGLKNVVNSCFMNAALQSLFSLDSLAKVLLNLPPNFYTKGSISDVFVQILADDKKPAASTVVDPEPFCKMGWNMLNVNQRTQQDSNEFIRELLNRLGDKDIREVAQRADNAIVNLFLVRLQPYVNDEPRHLESYNILDIPLPEKATTLNECLQFYFSPEPLEGGGQKIVKIQHMSNYLMIGPIRTIDVAKDPKNPVVQKLQNPLSFPLTGLSLEPYADPGITLPRYSLKACIIHAGQVNAGHYTAYVRRSQQWYFTDDEAVTEVSLDHMQKIAAQGFGNTIHQVPFTFIYEVE